MKVTPDELITFIYEVERKTKTELKREEEKKPKQRLIVAGVYYTVENIERCCAMPGYSEIVVDGEHKSACRQFIDQINVKMVALGYETEFNIISLEYIVSKEGKPLYKFTDFRDTINRKIEY